MKNILIPTDFSDNSWNAIKYGLAHFKDTTCAFYLLHVSIHSYLIQGDPQLISSVAGIEKTLLEQTNAELENLVLKIKKEFPNEKHHFYTLSSYSFFIECVKKYVEEKNIDLIIMGTKGASGIKSVIIGSNTGDLITQVKCPVLIVPENAAFNIPKEIAFPTDYNIYYQPEVLNGITEFGKMYNSSIRILHVARKNEELSTFQIENKELLHIFFMDEKHSFHHITNKNIEEGIQCFCESRDIDLIVMVAKNVNLFQRILFKPTIEDISYHTEIPFLVLHE